MAKKTTGGSKNNPRHKNGNLRRKYRARLKAQGGPCGICHGKYGDIHYDEPSDWKHPLSFVVDEIIPVSRWKEYGYSSPEAVAQDWDNLQAAHWCCNQAKRDKVIGKNTKKMINGSGSTVFPKSKEKYISVSQIQSRMNILDGQW